MSEAQLGWDLESLRDLEQAGTEAAAPRRLTLLDDDEAFLEISIQAQRCRRHSLAASSLASRTWSRLGPRRRLPGDSRSTTDEAQDLNPLYFALICKVVRDISRARPRVQLVYLGDDMQSINQHKG
jgi:hypothetical protein